MNWFYKVSLVFILFIMVSLKLNAQHNSTYLRHAIKTNVFQWFMNEPNVVYEYKFSRKFGLETTLGTYGINNRDIHTNLDFTEPLPQKGIVLRFNPKLYISSLKLRRSDYYISPMLLFKYQVAEGSWSSISESVEKIEKRLILGSSILLGYQSVVGRRLMFDFYFGGGIRYRHINETIFSGNSSDGGMYDPQYLPFTSVSGEWMPSIHLGVKLGYAFKPIN